ncbi:MAG: SpoIIE family protein phosphatase [Gaiellales bacterium]
MSDPTRRSNHADAVPRELESAVMLAVAESRGIGDAGERVLGAIAAHLGMQTGVLWRLDPAGECLVVSATWSAHGGAAEFLDESRGRRFARGDGLPGAAWVRGESIWIPDVSSSALYVRAAAAQAAGLRGAVGIPLTAHGSAAGVVELLAPNVVEANPAVSRMLEELGSQVGRLLERVHADETIAESEARKAAVLDAALDAIVTADAEGRILEANRTVAGLLGWEPQDLIGARIVDTLVPPELRDDHTIGFAGYVETGEGRMAGRRMEVDALHRSGERVPVELTVTRIDRPGPPIFTAYLRDTRARRQVDEERARLLSAETAARTSAEAAWQRLRLVSDVSELLAVVFSYPEAFERLSERVVADIADICLIDTVDERGAITRVAAKHRDERMQPLADRLRREFAPDVGGAHPVASVVKTTRARFSPFMSDEFLRATCRSDEHYELVQALGFQSYITVPLIARTRTLGALTLVSTDPNRRYTEQDLAVAEEIARRASIRIDNARLYQERDRVAHVLQQGLLPRRLPEVPGLAVATRYFPAGAGIEAGGDFYDVFAAGSQRWGLVIGDVCGKGPEAAAGMAIARPALRALAHAYRRPTRLLHALNDELLDQGVDGRFLTLAYVQVRVTGDTGAELTTCLAGHHPAIVVTRGGVVRDVGRPGTLLGLYRDISLHEQRTRLNRGDTLLLYTDGLADEPVSPAPMTRDELASLIVEHRGEDVERLAARIERAVRSASRRADGPDDDIAYLLVRCTR